MLRDRVPRSRLLRERVLRRRLRDGVRNRLRGFLPGPGDARRHLRRRVSVATAAADCECPAGCACPAPCECPADAAPAAPSESTVENKIARLTDFFNTQMNNQGWVEALATAERAHTIAPNLPHTALMVWKAKFAAREAAGKAFAAAKSASVIPAAHAAPAPVAAPSRIPAGTFTRTLNDQRVTVTFAPTGPNAGTVSGTCTVPNGGCELTFSGDCTATADGLIYGAVCTAKTCGAADADPTAKLSVEAFCQALIDQPFSLRCRETEGGCTISAVKFAGVGIVGTPAPGEPAYLLLTMFSGAYDAE